MRATPTAPARLFATSHRLHLVFRIVGALACGDVVRPAHIRRNQKSYRLYCRVLGMVVVGSRKRIVAAWCFTGALIIVNHLVGVCQSFAPHHAPPHPHRQYVCQSTVDDVSLEGLGDNHEQVGSKLSESVAAWLDAEWMPQDIHIRMGESAKQSYISCRERGEDEIMSIMMQVANDLTERWMEEYDQDAFVNAWDVANYVSDYLTQQSGNEGCECSTPVY